MLVPALIIHAPLIVRILIEKSDIFALLNGRIKICCDG